MHGHMSKCLNIWREKGEKTKAPGGGGGEGRTCLHAVIRK
jgi:hypothetical protein